MLCPRKDSNLQPVEPTTLVSAFGLLYRLSYEGVEQLIDAFGHYSYGLFPCVARSSSSGGIS